MQFGEMQLAARGRYLAQRLICTKQRRKEAQHVVRRCGILR